MKNTNKTAPSRTTTIAQDALALAKRIQTELTPTMDLFRLVKDLEALAAREER